MLDSLYSGLSGLQQFQNGLDVIGNNIANSNTVAYKSASVDAADSFSQTLQDAGAGRSAMQVGTGAVTGAIRSDFTQGSLTAGISSDLSVNGAGYFIVRDSVSGAQFATRAGDFNVNPNGFLVTNSGMRVQGFSDSGLTTRGDLQIDGTGRPATSDPLATLKSYSIDEQGQVHVTLSDNTSFVRGQVLLQSFSDPQSLLKQGDNLYSGLTAAGPTTTTTQAPGSNGLGSVEAGKLEMSNVNLAKEFTDLITTQRGFQASARMITTSDEILQEVVALKR